MANVSWVCPTIHPDLAICDEGVPGHSILFRDAAATPRADETTLLAATLVAQTARRPVPRSGPRRGGLGGVPRRADRRRRPSATPGCYHRPGAPRWTSDSNRRRPERDGPSDRAASDGPRPSPEDPVAERPHDPDPTPTSRAPTAGTREFETYADFDLPTYVGADDAS